MSLEILGFHQAVKPGTSTAASSILTTRLPTGTQLPLELSQWDMAQKFDKPNHIWENESEAIKMIYLLTLSTMIS